MSTAFGNGCATVTRNDGDRTDKMVLYDFATLRSHARSFIGNFLGEKFERGVHRAFHNLLRLIGRFDIPEPRLTLELLRLLISKSACYIDVGANVGRYAWFMAQNAGPNLRIIAFEPNPRAAELLRAALANVRNTSVFEIGLAESDRKAVLRIPRDARGNQVSALGWIDDAEQEGLRDGRIVECRALDHLVEEGVFAPDGPLLLKIDVEGAELSVLEGAKEILRRYRPAIYFECEAAHIERAGRKPEALWSFLVNQGYRVFHDNGDEFRYCSFAKSGISNYFAIPFSTAKDFHPNYSSSELTRIFFAEYEAEERQEC
jgi:FkbM family methyltransferase